MKSLRKTDEGGGGYCPAAKRPELFAFDVAIKAHWLLRDAVAPLLPPSIEAAWVAVCECIAQRLADAADRLQAMPPKRCRRIARRCWPYLTKLTTNSRVIAIDILADTGARDSFLQQAANF